MVAQLLFTCRRRCLPKRCDPVQIGSLTGGESRALHLQSRYARSFKRSKAFRPFRNLKVTGKQLHIEGLSRSLHITDLFGADRDRAETWKKGVRSFNREGSSETIRETTFDFSTYKERNFLHKNRFDPSFLEWFVGFSEGGW